VCTDCPAELARDLDGAFATLVAHHQNLVFGMARRMTRNAEDAEDLAQEAFLRAYRALGGYEKSRIHELRLRGWLARITLNLGRNRARGLGPATTELNPSIEPSDPARDRPESVAERRETALYWQGLLTALPPRFRRAVELRHVEGLSYGELAEALDKPVGTVKSDVHRGTRLLRAAHERERELERDIRDTRLMEVAR
jgi:RNA polymerase sigma factor (sigma-70 family)